MHGYWAARGLAQRGHNVFVVTNADEVEPAYRIHLTAADRGPKGEYARSFPDAGSVTVLSTQPPDRRKMAYIPLNNPTVTRLATMATNVIREHDCKVIYSYYLEPFGMAAHLASLWTGVPYVFQHAGSDLYRLSILEDLQAAYKEVMRGANRVFSSGSSREVVVSYGVPEERLASGSLFGLPIKYFNPEAPPLDFPALFQDLVTSNDERWKDGFEDLDESLPKLGLYGKLGEFKGSFDLLHAMAKLVRSGFPFYLMAMSGGWQKGHFTDLINELGLAKYVRFLPFLPHWRVPSFIRACTAVTFLERDFPIIAHGPTIPSEVIACGKCLVVSGEAARKQKFHMQMRNFKNIVIVPDPKEHDTLASCFRFALEDAQRAEEIGRRGYEEFSVARDYHEDYVNRLENLLTEVSAEQPVIRKETSEPKLAPVSKEAAESPTLLFPFTRALLSSDQWDQFRQIISECLSDESELRRRLIGYLEADPVLKSSPARDVCEFECELLELRKNGQSGEEHKTHSITFSPEQVESLVPAIRGHFKVVRFPSDVSATAEAIKQGKPIPQTENETRVLFHSDTVPMFVNQETETLLNALAQQPRTTSEIIDYLSESYECEDAAARARLREACFSVLEGLYWAGIVELRSANFEQQPLSRVRGAAE